MNSIKCWPTYLQDGRERLWNRLELFQLVKTQSDRIINEVVGVSSRNCSFGIFGIHFKFMHSLSINLIQLLSALSFTLSLPFQPSSEVLSASSLSFSFNPGFVVRQARFSSLKVFKEVASSKVNVLMMPTSNRNLTSRNRRFSFDSFHKRQRNKLLS